VVSSGRPQQKAEYLPKSTVSGSRSDFQAGAAYLPIANSAGAAASASSKTTVNKSSSVGTAKALLKDQSPTTGNASSEAIVGFQTTLVPVPHPVPQS
jgi:hypothetical protein